MREFVCCAVGTGTCCVSLLQLSFGPVRLVFLSKNYLETRWQRVQLSSRPVWLVFLSKNCLETRWQKVNTGVYCFLNQVRKKIITVLILSSWKQAEILRNQVHRATFKTVLEDSRAGLNHSCSLSPWEDRNGARSWKTHLTHRLQVKGTNTLGLNDEDIRTPKTCTLHVQTEGKCIRYIFVNPK